MNSLCTRSVTVKGPRRLWGQCGPLLSADAQYRGTGTDVEPDGHQGYGRQRRGSESLLLGRLGDQAAGWLGAACGSDYGWVMRGIAGRRGNPPHPPGFVWLACVDIRIT